MPHPAFQLCAARAIADADAPARHLRHRRTGAQVLVLPAAGAERVFALSLAAPVPDGSGVAHVLEHLVFRGSRRFGCDDLFAALHQAVALGDLNATTTQDRTGFHLSCGSEPDLAAAIEVLLDAVFAPLLTAPAFEAERAVIRNEMRGYRAAPANAIAQGLRAGLNAGPPYGVDHGGTDEGLSRLTRDALRAFHAGMYRADRARIFLAGDLDLPARLAQIDRLLPDLPGAALPDPPLRRRPFAAPRATQLAHPAGQGGGVAWAFDTGPQGAGGLPEALIPLVLCGLPQALLGPVAGPGLAPDLPWGELRLVTPEPAALIDRLSRALEDPVPPALAEAALVARDLTLGAETPLETHARIAGPWRHGAGPLALLDQRAEVARALDQPKELARALTDRLRRDLRDTPHRLTLTLVPGPAEPPPPAAPRPRVQAARAALPFAPRVAILTPRSGQAEGSVLHLPARAGDLARIDLALRLTDPAAAGLWPLLARWLGGGAAASGVRITPEFRGGWLVLRGLARAGQGARLAAALAECLTAPSPDPATAQDWLAAQRRRIGAELAVQPHLFAERRLRAAAGPAGAWSELVAGLSQHALSVAPEDLVARLIALRAQALAGPRRVALTDPALATALLGPEPPLPAQDPTPPPPPHEAHPRPEATHTVAQGWALPPGGVGLLAAHALEHGWLRDRVRREGGAYGVRATHDRATGLLTALSARDPQPAATLDRLAEAPGWLARLSGDDIARVLPGAAGRLDRPLSGQARLSEAVNAFLDGDDAARRQADHADLLGATPARLADYAAAMAAARPSTVLLGPEPGLRTLCARDPGIAWIG